MNILIVEDSKMLRETLHDGLSKLGYGVDAVGDGKEGLYYARFKKYDVIVLDLMLPGMDGLLVLRELRAARNQTHVLILSAKDLAEDRVRGLQHGADDYMIKPFSFDELCARIGALIRRQYDAKSPLIVLGGLTLNTSIREARHGTKRIPLTPGEYSILECLVFNRGRTISAEQLLDASHSSEETPGKNLIQVMVCNLRKKLAAAGEAEVVKTQRGYGYYIE
ncbi:MAG: response regulator transcription factor [Verrucomicrobiota bacterium]|nr:response regulator transcription factor [Verrucomicrobiota bacterium]